MACRASALDPRQPVSTYLRTEFTVEDGLPSNVVNSIVQSKGGFLWIATSEGLARFDGRHFLSVELVPNQPQVRSIACLALGTDGDLWLGTPTGAMRISRGSLDRLGPLPTVNYPVGSAVTNLLVAHDGVLWASTTARVFPLHGSAFSLVVPNVHGSRSGGVADSPPCLATHQALLDMYRT